jgi:hypothetical protein
VIAALLPLVLFSGCAMQAARYQPAIDNVEWLRRNAPPLNVGAFKAQPGLDTASTISLRGNPMSSPAGPDYATYLADALRAELTLAGKLDPNAKIVVSGVLVKNDISAGGFVTNSGEIEARFSVVNGGAPRFDKQKRVALSWDSSFVGAVAIPKAQQQYPLLVQELLKQLLADPEFGAALK